MNKMKYISSDDICVFIKSLRQNAFNDNFEINLLANLIEDYIKHAKDAIVRCKDCIHGIENGELCGQKIYLCSCMTNPNEFYGDFYCASGERKESKIKKCFDIPKEVAERLLEDTERKETNE